MKRAALLVLAAALASAAPRRMFQSAKDLFPLPPGYAVDEEREETSREDFLTLRLAGKLAAFADDPLGLLQVGNQRLGGACAPLRLAAQGHGQVVRTPS